jgi:hypothetical protein
MGQGARNAARRRRPPDAALPVAERRPRTARVQLEARERGRTYHLATPEEQARRDAEIKRRQAEDPDAVGISAEWVYAYDACNAFASGLPPASRAVAPSDA